MDCPWMMCFTLVVERFELKAAYLILIPQEDFELLQNIEDPDEEALELDDTAKDLSERELNEVCYFCTFSLLMVR